MADGDTAPGEIREGCSVIENQRIRSNCRDINSGSFSIRNYFGIDFEEIYEACEQDAEDPDRRNACELTVRSGFERIEDGRFAQALLKLSDTVAAFDPDEIDEFKDRFPDIYEKINQAAAVDEALQPEFKRKRLEE